MSRVEVIGGATLYLADCRDVLASIKPAQTVVYDPPFEAWDTVEPVKAETTLAFCSPQSRHEVERVLGKPRAEIVWHFEDGRWVSDALPRITHDYVYLYGRSGSARVGDTVIDRAPIKKGAGCIGKDRTGMRVYTPSDRKQLNSVQIFPRNMSNPLGAWGKPVALMTRLLEWTGGDGLVLDPYMGSGTACLAALALNRPCIGIEIDADHFDIACRRIEEAYRQPRLFDEPKQKAEQLTLLGDA